jgi:hypothetical protein
VGVNLVSTTKNVVTPALLTAMVQGLLQYLAYQRHLINAFVFSFLILRFELRALSLLGR